MKTVVVTYGEYPYDVTFSTKGTLSVNIGDLYFVSSQWGGTKMSVGDKEIISLPPRQ